MRVRWHVIIYMGWEPSEAFWTSSFLIMKKTEQAKKKACRAKLLSSSGWCSDLPVCVFVSWYIPLIWRKHQPKQASETTSAQNLDHFSQEPSIIKLSGSRTESICVNTTIMKKWACPLTSVQTMKLFKFWATTTQLRTFSTRLHPHYSVLN